MYKLGQEDKILSSSSYKEGFIDASQDTLVL